MQNKTVGGNFVLIPGGTFRMGSPESEAWRSEDETQHSVTVSDFYMGCYEVTQAEYEVVTGQNPSDLYFVYDEAAWSQMLLGQLP